MVRSFNARVQCHSCGCLTTTETPFERWMRSSRLLDTSEGIVRFDLDVLVHRYMGLRKDKFGSRDVQAMMFVEVKTMGARPTESQRDTLHALNQVFRNGRDNMHKKRRGAHAKNHIAPTKTYSVMKKREITLRLYGGHLLRLEHQSPEDSKWMEWDNKHAIDAEILTKLLRFELSPDSLEPIDWRRRSYTQQSLPGMPVVYPLLDENNH